MIKSLVFALCALFALPALAQKDCMPADLLGSGTVSKVTSNQHGVSASWWCSDGFKWYLRVRVANWSWLTTSVRADFVALKNSPTPRTVFDAMEAKYKPRSIFYDPALDDPVTGSPLLPVMDEAALKTIFDSEPPAPVYVVAKNGQYTTRPTYPLTGTVGQYVRTRVQNGTMPVLTTVCDCGTRVQEPTLYCKVKDEPLSVALCARQ